MTYQEMLERMREASKQRHQQSHEHHVQVACVNWFRLQYPELDGLLFAIPNGGQRNKIVAAKLKAEGVVAGVADMMLAVASKDANGLFIEMKTDRKGSRQSDKQKEWQAKVCQKGYLYKIARTLDEFMKLIKDYLDET